MESSASSTRRSIFTTKRTIFLAACLTLYMAGVTDPKTLLMAGVAAIAPVVLRYLNPNDKSFGVTGE